VTVNDCGFGQTAAIRCVRAETNNDPRRKIAIRACCAGQRVVVR
jgi:hypothetical protein